MLYNSVVSNEGLQPREKSTIIGLIMQQINTTSSLSKILNGFSPSVFYFFLYLSSGLSTTNKYIHLIKLAI